MDPITLGLLFGSVMLMGASINTEGNPSVPANATDEEIKNEVLARLKDATRITIPPKESWVEVDHGAEKWLVAPYYIAPVGIGEAVRVAKINELSLPSPALVDSIWKAADLKLEPQPRGPNSKPPSHFTPETMNSPEVHINQLSIIQNQIQAQNPNFKLLAGSHKDVVSKDGKVGIYGWHKLNGKIIQDFYTGHDHSENPIKDWKDYSQGLRLVKRIA